MKLMPAAAAAVVAVTSLCSSSPYITVASDGTFRHDDTVYRFVGTNFWYGPILAADGPWGDHERLTKELDSLHALGLDNLRVLAGAEGPEGLPHHIAPVLQTAPGKYNDILLTGLDRFMAELERRDMHAVVYLTNAWEWSGGYGSYLQWSGEGVAPVPGIDGYREYVDHVSRFVLNESARRMAVEHARFMASRINSVTGKPYAESPALMAWQICNEPRAFSDEGKEALAEWIAEMARAIRSADPNHLISTGSEGLYGCESDLDLWRRIHSMPEIDYACIHLWPTNWGWASRDSVEAHVGRAIELSDRYIDLHIEAMSTAKKPLVIEEFGYPRDGFAFSPEAGTSARDVYYEHLLRRFAHDPRISGLNFWGWNGLGRADGAANPPMWHPGADYLCDPAHEPQGMYGVFSTDASTIGILTREVCGGK